METDVFVLIVILGLVTFAVRSGGHVMMLMFKRIHPRVEAALDAIPAAVLTTIVVPAVMNGGWKEALALVVAALVGLRYGVLTIIGSGTATIIILRMVFGI